MKCLKQVGNVKSKVVYISELENLENKVRLLRIDSSIQNPNGCSEYMINFQRELRSEMSPM